MLKSTPLPRQWEPHQTNCMPLVFMTFLYRICGHISTHTFMPLSSRHPVTLLFAEIFCSSCPAPVYQTFLLFPAHRYMTFITHCHLGLPCISLFSPSLFSYLLFCPRFPVFFSISKLAPPPLPGLTSQMKTKIWNMTKDSQYMAYCSKPPAQMAK